MLDPQVEENPLVVDETGVLTPIRVRKSSLIRDGGGGGCATFFHSQNKLHTTSHQYHFPITGDGVVDGCERSGCDAALVL